LIRFRFDHAAIVTPIG